MTAKLNPVNVHQEVRQLWARLLDVPVGEVHPDSNFFLDGGDSLTAVELVVELGDRLGIEVSLDPLFVHGTVEAVVDAILLDVGTAGDE